MPDSVLRGLPPALPLQPQLRRDAAVLVPRRGQLHIAVSARHVVTVANATPDLVDWLMLLDGTVPLDAAVACAPLPAAQARYLLHELDRGGFLADANEGLLFRHGEAASSDALRLAQQTRAGVRRSTGHRPAAPTTGFRIRVSGSRGWPTALRTALAVPGLQVQLAADRPDLTVVIADALDPAAEEAAAAAMANGAAHLCVAVSAVDAVMLPVTLPGRTACRRCWALQRDHRIADWPAWTYGGRLPDPPHLPAHHKALVLSLVVEHVLSVLPVLHCPDDPAAMTAACVERFLDLRRGTVEVTRMGSHPACGCIRGAA